MNLTTAERKRLAKEMRGLAMQCVAGSAPDLDPASWACCSIGESLVRAGIADRGHDNLFDWFAVQIARELDALLPAAAESDFIGVVSEANYLQARGELPGAVVFPLLALADEVEQPPAGPQEVP